MMHLPAVLALVAAFGTPVVPNTENHVFEPVDPSHPATTDGQDSRSVGWVDFDGDGDLDLFVTNYAQANRLYEQTPGGVFVDLATGDLVSDFENSMHAAWGDLDGDGDLDVFVSNANSASNSLYMNQGGLQGGEEGDFAKFSGDEIVTAASNSYGAAWGDLDGNGDLDLAVANRGEPNVLYMGSGSPAGFTRVTSGPVVSGSLNSRGVAFGDVDGDGDLDMVFANSNGDDNDLFVNQGGDQGGTQGEFAPRPGDPAGSGGGASFAAEFGDLDNDGDLDLAFANRYGENNFFFRNDGTTFTAMTSPGPASDGGDTYTVAFADFENDGDLDVALANRNEPNHVYSNLGSWSFERTTVGDAPSTSDNSRDVALGDMDADGDTDMAVANTGGQDNAVYENAGLQWIDLGNALGGPGGTPVLTGSGDLVASTQSSLHIADGPANTATIAVAGLSTVDLPVKGGILVPDTDMVVTGFQTNASGQLQIDFRVPAVTPAGTMLYFQVWMVEPANTDGFVATNGLSGRTF